MWEDGRKQEDKEGGVNYEETQEEDKMKRRMNGGGKTYAKRLERL